MSKKESACDACGVDDTWLERRVLGVVITLALGITALSTISLVRAEAATAAAANEATVQGSATATVDQRDMEKLALKLAKQPAVEQARREARKQFLADRAAGTAAGVRTLDGALDEMVFNTIADVANSDASQPRVQWVSAAEHSWFGLNVPGARLGLDNPDNIYRSVTIDGESIYRITGRLAKAPGIQYSFLVYGSAPDEAERLKTIDTPLAGLLDKDLKTEADGSFVITIDSEPANGRVNHLQTNRYASKLLLRDTLGDWTQQAPASVHIERVGGPVQPRVTEAELVRRAASAIPTDVTYWLKFNNGYIYQAPANKFAKPVARGGGWGFMAQGNFDLAADEALIVTIDPLAAKYIGFQLGDPWLRSREYRHKNGSLNNTQAKPNSDGSFTYVIAARDPGIYNWLDSDGLQQGSMLIRWQALAKKVDKAEGVIKQTQKVRIADLERLLPKDVARATPAEREAQLAARLASYQLRLRTL